MSETGSQIDDLLKKQREKTKEEYGALASFVWIIFIIILLVTDELNLITLKLLLMIIPGLLIGAISMIIPYLILHKGMLYLGKKLNLSLITLSLIGWVNFLIEVIYVWYIAKLYFYLLNLYI